MIGNTSSRISYIVYTPYGGAAVVLHIEIIFFVIKFRSKPYLLSLIPRLNTSFDTCFIISLFLDWTYLLTRRVSLVEQELPTIPEHLSSLPVFSGVRVTRFLVICVMCCRSLFVLFPLATVFSVFLPITASDNHFGIFKLFLMNVYINLSLKVLLDACIGVTCIQD